MITLSQIIKEKLHPSNLSVEPVMSSKNTMAFLIEFGVTSFCIPATNVDDTYPRTDLPDLPKTEPLICIAFGFNG